MRRALAVFVVLLAALMMPMAYAEELSYHEARDMVQEANASIASLYENSSDADTQEILQFCQYQLTLIEAGLSFVLPEDIVLQDTDLFADETPEEGTIEKIMTVLPTYIDDLGYGQGYTLCENDNYKRIENSVYSADLNDVYEFVRIEVALKPDTSETMVLLTQIRYDDLLTSSNRYLVYEDAAEIKSIYCRTFGEDVEYRIDISAWAAGQEYEWEDTLLYPALTD